MSMTREEAVTVLYTLVNSGILDSELEESLNDIATHICNDDFEECKGNPYCEGCVFKELL